MYFNTMMDILTDYYPACSAVVNHSGVSYRYTSPMVRMIVFSIEMLLKVVND